MYNNDNIFITWHYQARSKNLSKLLGLHLYEKQIDDNFFKRHLGSFFWTWKVLLQKRPKTIYIQLSFLLLVAVYLYKKFSLNKVYIVADCHTKALRRSMNNNGSYVSRFVRLIKKICFKAVDVSIISNTEMVDDIEKLHSNYIILPDQIPELEYIDENAPTDNIDKYVVMVCSYAVDEPYQEMIESARYLPDELMVYMTGKPPKSVRNKDHLPQNLHFSGYVSFKKYYELITHAQCIVGLTTERGCLQSCAYEGLAVETPMVLSETNALKNYFESAAIYTNHEAEGIASAIQKAIKNKQTLKSEIQKVKRKRKKGFNEQIEKLKSFKNK